MMVDFHGHVVRFCMAKTTLASKKVPRGFLSLGSIFFVGSKGLRETVCGLDPTSIQPRLLGLVRILRAISAHCARAPHS